MLKAACVCFMGQNQRSRKEIKWGKELGIASTSMDWPYLSKDFAVRIVHAGGREELYHHEIPASYLMEKYPGMCVARPEVFRNPQKSLLRPEENLLPGQKYLMIPSTTARKLKLKQMKARATEGKDELSDVNITWEAGRDISGESVSSAKEFYTAKGKPSGDSKRSSRTRRISKPRKPFAPPLPKARILRTPNWEPSLTSVQELSP